MRSCPVDGTQLTGRADQRFCSERCRKRAGRGAVVPLRKLDDAAPTVALKLADAVREELRRADAESSGLGVSALLLAARIDAAEDPGSALAALNRELRATLAEATRGQVKSGLATMRDELAERRRA